ncbi:MAG: hypothetical protein ACK4P1_05770 [Aggregatilineales bacterium]
MAERIPAAAAFADRAVGALIIPVSRSPRDYVVLWRRELWHNGALMQAAAYLWGARGDGQAVFFFGQAEGFPTGDYEIRLYLGASEIPAARAAFRLE